MLIVYKWFFTQVYWFISWFLIFFLRWKGGLCCLFILFLEVVLNCICFDEEDFTKFLWSIKFLFVKYDFLRGWWFCEIEALLEIDFHYLGSPMMILKYSIVAVLIFFQGICRGLCFLVTICYTFWVGVFLDFLCVMDCFPLTSLLASPLKGYNNKTILADKKKIKTTWVYVNSTDEEFFVAWV